MGEAGTSIAALSGVGCDVIPFLVAPVPYKHVARCAATAPGAKFKVVGPLDPLVHVGIKKLLQRELAGVLSEEQLGSLPRGFQQLADVVILNLREELLPHKREIAEAYLRLVSHAKSVYLRKGPVRGRFREPGEFELLAGPPRSEVVHKENGVYFKFDFHKVMWSKGNLHERRYLPTLVADGESVLDMFAGIGYFSLMIGVHARPRQVWAVEWNPVAYKYLVENVALNGLEGVVRPVFGDCEWVCGMLCREGFQADRIVMGVLPAPKDYLDAALSVARPEGCVVHYEGLADDRDVEPLFSDVVAAAESVGYGAKLLDHRFVKSYGPRVDHAVLDVFVSRTDQNR
ncbi:MAG: class I SAM-dependent methyltransferase family protein [Promethearchaeota archaeon]